MKKETKNVIANISSTATANLIGTVISMVTNLVAPKILGVEDYGYWQIYILYVGYVGFAELGWNEGLYLKLGGKKITQLKEQFVDIQFEIFVCFQLFLTLFFALLVYLLKLPNNWIYMIVALMILPSNIKNFCNYILLATNEIKNYAKVTTIDRVVFLIGLLWCFIFKKYSVENMILIDCLARVISSGYSLKKIKIVFCRRFQCTKKILLDIGDSIKCGSKLLIGNLAGSLSVGIVKMVVSWRWGITTFSQVSFTISITNMVLILINAIGMALFPILKTITTEQLVKIYQQLRTILSFSMIFCLLFYFPLKSILGMWLPSYNISLKYMGMIFPLIIYETRTAMLLNTYSKALRLERFLLIGNVLTLVFSFLAALISVYILNSINAAIISVFIVLMFRCIFLEIQLGKVIYINKYRDILLEIFMSLIFIFSATYVGGKLGGILYCGGIAVYIMINFSTIKDTLKWLWVSK